MNQPTGTTTNEVPVTASTAASPATRDRLATGDGQISVAEGVVQKIAGKACREVSGVHAIVVSACLLARLRAVSLRARPDAAEPR